MSIRSCTDGIIQVSEKGVTLLPREQKELIFEISSRYNVDLNHSCTGIFFCHFYYQNCVLYSFLTIVVLSDSDANIQDTRVVVFNTLSGCVYCPAGECTCEVRSCLLQAL